MGLKHFKALRGLIERLHFAGTQRDKTGNRDLHMDQYCSLLLLWFFSPMVDSLRGRLAGRHARQGTQALRCRKCLAGLAFRGRRCAAIVCTLSLKCCVEFRHGST